MIVDIYHQRRGQTVQNNIERGKDFVQIGDSAIFRTKRASEASLAGRQQAKERREEEGGGQVQGVNEIFTWAVCG